MKAFLEAFADSTTKAVICAKGGYGTNRILSLLDSIFQGGQLESQDVLKKRFFGFSDVTALHRWLHVSVPGYVSFHSPMPATSLFVEGTKESQLSFQAALFESELRFACPPLQGKCLQMGKASESGGIVSGRLVGGNLTLVTSLLGTPWQPQDLHKAILLLEDVNEETYRIDRMLTHMVNALGGARLWKNLGGLVLGNFTNMESEKYLGESPVSTKDDCDGSAMDVWFWLQQMNVPKSLPILSSLPIGHIRDNRVVALGAMVEMDLNKGMLVTVR